MEVPKAQLSGAPERQGRKQVGLSFCPPPSRHPHLCLALTRWGRRLESCLRKQLPLRNRSFSQLVPFLFEPRIPSSASPPQGFSSLCWSGAMM